MIKSCPDFSLENLDNISVIEISNGYDRDDWAALNNRSKVVISDHPYFRSADALNNVKEIVWINRDISPRVSLHYITHLSLVSCPDQFSSSFTDSLLSTASHLKEIEFRVYRDCLNSTDQQFLKLLKKYPVIKRIVIIEGSTKFNKLFQLFIIIPIVAYYLDADSFKTGLFQ